MRQLIILAFVPLLLLAQLPQPEAAYRSFTRTPYGTVFTDAAGGSLYLQTERSVLELVSSPGCGQYHTVSPDGRFIGFKSIGPDGLQAPALYDLATRNVTLLHGPVRQAGQVSFSREGSIVYSIGTALHIRRGSSVETADIGTYANIAAVSGDGRFIAYNDGNDQIWTYDRLNRSSAMVSNGRSSYHQPQWSPAGNALCYSGMDASVYVAAADGRVSYLGNGYDPVWSADGASLIVERRESERHTLLNSDLYRLPADGSPAERLTDTPDLFETSPSVTNGELLYTTHDAPVLHSRAGASVIDASAVTRLPEERTSAVMKAASPAVYFEMPYTHQVYDTPDWYNGHSACGPTSSIMVIAHFGILPAWNVWCSWPSPGHTSAYGNYVCDKYRFRQIDYVSVAQDPNDKDSWGGYGFMWSGGSPYSRMVNYYGQHGISATRADSSASFFSLVTNEVTNGHPYTLCNGLTTAGHIIVLNGIGAEAHTFISNDPYGNKNSGSYPSPNGKGVSYDWPGYNNGFRNLNRIYWGVSVRYTAPALGDTIVDDLQFTKGFMMNNAPPAGMFGWKDMNQGFNGHMWYVKTKKGDTCFAQWRPAIAADGNYAVSAYIPFSNAKAARYKVYHKNGMELVVKDQSPVKNGWLPLGTFPFAKGSAGYVRLGDGSDSTGQELVFDALQFAFSSPLSVTHRPEAAPSHLALEQNFPNPFNPSTTITFTVPVSGPVTLTVHDLLGRTVAVPVRSHLDAGRYDVPFDGAELSSGVYLYRLTAGGTTTARRMLLAK
ncbi:MAG: T9SS type A sorting domain-containing protein [Bacteroidetes bacterium]|nr:MAG: T9SS type A sorting domain-containing protein [Bacteroidota bacterium]